MKTMTIRHFRHRWPEAEKALATEAEILITRDGCPVARLLPLVEQRLWTEEFWGKDVFFDSMTGLQEGREDRQLP